MKEKLKQVGVFLQEFWNRLPKTVKVALYMLVAAILDETARYLTADMFSFIPALYRLSFFNFVEVLLVEGVKYFRRK